MNVFPLPSLSRFIPGNIGNDINSNNKRKRDAISEVALPAAKKAAQTIPSTNFSEKPILQNSQRSLVLLESQLEQSLQPLAAIISEFTNPFRSKINTADSTERPTNGLAQSQRIAEWEAIKQQIDRIYQEHQVSEEEKKGLFQRFINRDEEEIRKLNVELSRCKNFYELLTNFKCRTTRYTEIIKRNRKEIGKTGVDGVQVFLKNYCDRKKLYSSGVFNHTKNIISQFLRSSEEKLPFHLVLNFVTQHSFFMAMFLSLHTGCAIDCLNKNIKLNNSLYANKNDRISILVYSQQFQYIELAKNCREIVNQFIKYLSQSPTEAEKQLHAQTLNLNLNFKKFVDKILLTEERFAQLDFSKGGIDINECNTKYLVYKQEADKILLKYKEKLKEIVYNV